MPAHEPRLAVSGEFAGISAVGRSFEIDQIVFAHFRDGLIVEAWEIAEISSLRRQLDTAD